MKIIFFGSDNYSAIVLQALKQEKNLEIIKVIGDKESLSEVTKLSARPDVGILASFGAIIPREILNFPKRGILNIHPSLLPKYRGSSPVQFAILNVEKKTGVTIIKLDEKVDHGPIVAQKEEEIKENDTSQSLYQRLFKIGSQTLLTILPVFVEGRIELREQEHSQATYTKRLTRDDGQIDWSKPDDFKERFIRAMYPWPGAWTEIDIDNKELGISKKRLKILKAHLEYLSPITYHLSLDLVQLEGKKPVSWQEFQKGYPNFSLR